MHKLKIFTYFLMAFSGLTYLTGCRKLVEVDLPISDLTTESVYNNAGTAAGLLSGIYITMAGDVFANSSSININTALAGDELKLIDQSDGAKAAVYTNSFVEDIYGFWDQAFARWLYMTNDAIAGLSASKQLTDHTKKVLLGEAKFLRGLIYFYLVNIYGDVPLVLTTDVRSNIDIGRTGVDLVYDQIILDLKDAQAGLQENYLKPDVETVSEERIRPNKYTATALLARVYLYRQKWSEAATEASKVIDNSQYQLLEDLEQVFLKNSAETIWSLQPNNFVGLDLRNTKEAWYYIPDGDAAPKSEISESLLTSFEANDKRKQFWTREMTINSTTYTIPFKYRYGREETEYKENSMVLRLAEQYLIRAEARAHLNVLTGANSAEEDLNLIRDRAGLDPTTSTGSQDEMLQAILEERRKELFTEMSHRWFDLKRSNTIDDVMEEVCPKKGGTWAPHKALFPIPKDEFILNMALKGHQNPGYPEPGF